jgi:hypothetical protein
MAYGSVSVRRAGNKLILEIELPPVGEPSKSGRAENLVNPRPWIDFADGDGELGIKLTVCRPYGPRD